MRSTDKNGDPVAAPQAAKNDERRPYRKPEVESRGRIRPSLLGSPPPPP